MKVRWGEVWAMQANLDNESGVETGWTDWSAATEWVAEWCPGNKWAEIASYQHQLTARNINKHKSLPPLPPNWNTPVWVSSLS